MVAKCNCDSLNELLLLIAIDLPSEWINYTVNCLFAERFVFFFLFISSINMIDFNLIIGYRSHVRFPLNRKQMRNSQFCWSNDNEQWREWKGSKDTVKRLGKYLNLVTRWRQMMKFLPNKEEYFLLLLKIEIRLRPSFYCVCTLSNQSRFFFGSESISVCVWNELYFIIYEKMIWCKLQQKKKKKQFLRMFFFCEWERNVTWIRLLELCASFEYNGGNFFFCNIISELHTHDESNKKKRHLIIVLLFFFWDQIRYKHFFSSSKCSAIKIKREHNRNQNVVIISEEDCNYSYLRL